MCIRDSINNVIEITNHQNVKYNFMPVNLGQCDGNTITYEERSCKVKFILEYFIHDYRVAIRECTFEDIIEIDTFRELVRLDSTYDVG